MNIAMTRIERRFKNIGVTQCAKRSISLIRKRLSGHRINSLDRNDFHSKMKHGALCPKKSTIELLQTSWHHLIVRIQE